MSCEALLFLMNSMSTLAPTGIESMRTASLEPWGNTPPLGDQTSPFVPSIFVVMRTLEA